MKNTDESNFCAIWYVPSGSGTVSSLMGCGSGPRCWASECVRTGPSLRHTIWQIVWPIYLRQWQPPAAAPPFIISLTPMYVCVLCPAAFKGGRTHRPRAAQFTLVVRDGILKPADCDINIRLLSSRRRLFLCERRSLAKYLQDIKMLVIRVRRYAWCVYERERGPAAALILK